MAILKLNEAVTFGKNGSIREMDPSGFDLSEPGMSWTQDEVAGFSVTLGGTVPLDAMLRLNIHGRPFIQPERIERQQFFVFLNGLFVGFRTLTAAAEIQFPLPRNVLSPRGVRVEFVIPTASSPKSLGLSEDIRKLGIALSSVSLALQK
jgi:hypothetical protein